jgi:hypothetical protein
MPKAGTKTEARQAISAYLNQGGSPAQLQDEIAHLGPIVDTFQVFPFDFEKDGRQEIVLAINFNAPEGGSADERFGVLSIYRCMAGKYLAIDLTYGQKLETEVLAIKDMIGSKLPDLLVKIQDNYNSGFDEFVALYTFTQSGWIESFKTEWTSGEIKVKLIDSGGTKTLVIDSYRGCAYMACGPWRKTRLTYTIGRDKTELSHYELLPSPYRIHVLEDAENALDKGNIEDAIRIYDQAARDNDLIDELSRPEDEMLNNASPPAAEIRALAHAYQTSFAYFREFALLLYLGNEDQANSILAEMKTLYPEGKAGNEFIDISAYLVTQLDAGTHFIEACTITNDYIAQKYILGANTFVYAHLNFWGDQRPDTGERLCPELEQK